jgi:dienelactone hydrolase
MLILAVTIEKNESCARYVGLNAGHWRWFAAAVVLWAWGGASSIGFAEEPTAPADEHRQLMFYRDDAGQRQPVKTRDDWKRRRTQILTGMQAAMGELPARHADQVPTIEVLETVDEPKFTRQSVIIAVDEQNRVPALLYLPTNRPDDERLPAVMALHQTVAIGKREVDGQGTPDQCYGRELAERGYVVLAPDYPSFGDYKCDFTDPKFASGTIQGAYNHMRCVDFLAGHPRVDPQRIGAIGHSLGGHNAMFLAAFDPRVRATVSSCGWTPFHEYYGGDLAGWTTNKYMPRLRTHYGSDPDRVPFDFYEVVAALAPRAFLSISPLHDHNFDVEGVRTAIPVIKEVYQLFDAAPALEARYPDCKHSFPLAEREAAYKFLEHHLGPQQP